MAIESTLLFGLKVDNTTSECWHLEGFRKPTQDEMREICWLYAKPPLSYHKYSRWREVFNKLSSFEQLVKGVKLAVEDRIEQYLESYKELYDKYGKTISDTVYNTNLGPGSTK